MSAFYDSESKLLNDRGIKKLLSQENKYSSWLVLESALAKAQGEFGVIPKEAAKNIGESCKIENIDFEEMDRIYREIGHGFVPFLKVLIKACDEESGKYVHYGITTQNIQQSAQLYVAKQVHVVFKSFIEDILHNWAQLANTYHDAPMAGRTHGQHALPISFGYKIAVFMSELEHAYIRLQETEKRFFSVMMGGAVGAFNSQQEEVGKKVQDKVAQILDMASMDIPSRSTNVYKVEYISALSLMVTTIHRFAEEVYATSGEEYRELSEPFKKGTVGSSTMPQKINPKLAKGIIANAEKLYTLISLGIRSCIKKYEGDSAAYMMIDGTLQEAFELTTEILMRAEKLTKDIVVYPENMKKNLTLSHGLINSEYLMMKIAEKIGKDKAHSIVYEIAIKTAQEQSSYLDNIMQHPLIQETFTRQEVETFLNPINYMGLSSHFAKEQAQKYL